MDPHVVHVSLQILWQELCPVRLIWGAHSSRPFHEPLTHLTAAKLWLLWIRRPFECACKCTGFPCCTQTLWCKCTGFPCCAQTLRVQKYGIPVLYSNVVCANVRDSCAVLKHCVCKCTGFLCCAQTLPCANVWDSCAVARHIAHANVQDSRLYQITFGYITGTLCICLSIQTDIKSTVNVALLYCGSLASAGGHGVGIEVYQHSYSSFWPFVHG